MSEYADSVTSFDAPLVRLALLMAEGRGETEEAHALRDDLAAIESRLDNRQRIFLHALSSDLYLIEDDEIYDDRDSSYADDRTLGGAIYTAYRKSDWDTLLELLRQHAPFIPQSVRAYLRGRAYEALGRNAAAWAFFSDAARRDEDRVAYDYFALQALLMWDLGRAYSLSKRYVDDPDSHPALLFLSASTIHRYYRPTIGEHLTEVKDLARILLGALGRAQQLSGIPQAVVALGYATLYTLLVELRDFAGAVTVLRVLEPISPDAHAINDEIAEYEGRVRAGQSINSGVLLSLTEPFPSESYDFTEVIENRIAEALLVTV